MNEHEQDDALRALFAAQEPPGQEEAFAASVIQQVSAERDRRRLRINTLVIAGGVMGGVALFPHLPMISQTLMKALADAVPAVPDVPSGVAALALALAASAAAYAYAERA